MLSIEKIFQKNTNHLSADELNTFRIKYRHLKVVIIDEISMVGNMIKLHQHSLKAADGNKRSVWWFEC